MTANAVDVTSATFAKEVLDASKSIPVVVDFWAPWCGPCRVLKPILEKLAAEYGGRFRLAKVNSDENPDLSATYGIRSIPDVMAFVDGKPVAHFLGAQPESQVRAFIDKLLPSPAELERVRAGELRAAGKPSEAITALQAAIALDERNDRARLELAELLIELERGDEAVPVLEAIRPDTLIDARVEALRAAVGFAGTRGGNAEDFSAALASDPDDLDARLSLAGLHAGNHRYAEALDALLEIVRRNKDWKDGEARRQILAIFSLAADQPDLVSDYRRKLAAALY